MMSNVIRKEGREVPGTFSKLLMPPLKITRQFCTESLISLIITAFKCMLHPHAPQLHLDFDDKLFSFFITILDVAKLVKLLVGLDYCMKTR